VTQTKIKNEYFIKYGLTREPFPNDIDDIFYITPELNHRIDLIRHLLEFSKQTLIITAPAAAGKSSLYNHLVASDDVTWAISKVVAREDMSSITLTHEAFRDSVIEDTDFSKHPINGLNNYLEFCDRNQKLPILLIDDAHKLVNETLNFIFQLTELKCRETFLRIVLFGNESLTDRVEDPIVHGTGTGILHSINIPPLSLEQTSSYIKYRLSACGNVSEFPFSQKDIKQIYKVSGGLPGNIDLLARQALQDPALFGGKYRNTLTYLRSRWLSPILKITIASIVFLSLVWYITSPELWIQKKPTNIVIKLPANKPLRSIIDAKEQQPTIEDNTGDSDVDTTIELSPITEPESTETTDEVPDPIIPPQLKQKLEPEMSIVLEQDRPEIIKPPVQAINKAPTTATVVNRGVKLLSKSYASMHGEQWLKEQSPDNYVLQLIGAHDQQTLVKFLQGQSSIINKIAMFTTYNDGKPWYVLVYGVYPNRDAAAAEVVSLSVKVKSYRPWPRSIASIHNDMDEKP